MTFRIRIVLAAAVLLAATFSLRAHAQGFRIGNQLIPESSLEYPGNIGIWAHTYLQILIGPRGGLGFDLGLGPAGGMTPAQMREAYSLPSTGGSQIIAIVDAYDDPNALADFNSFSSYFGLPTETSTNATASTNKVFQVLYGNGSKPRHRSRPAAGNWRSRWTSSGRTPWPPTPRSSLSRRTSSSFHRSLGSGSHRHQLHRWQRPEGQRDLQQLEQQRVLR